MLLTILTLVAFARPPVAAEMHERFDRITEARDAVIRGDLHAAHRAGQNLANLELTRRIPRAWRAGIAEVTAQATALSAAPDLVQAAQAVSRTAAACGSCHAAVRGGPSLERGRSLPDPAWEAQANMALHKWAADWMWLGLIAPDDEAWQRGAVALDEQPLDLKFASDPPPGHRPQLEQLVYVLAGRAKDAPPSDRSKILGQFLATCAECHVQRDP